jgi:hypothetical protein
MLSPEKLETTLDLMRHFGLNPDPWQLDVLRSEQPRLLLNCARQTGKTTIVAFLGLMEAMLNFGTNVFLVSRSMRQSREMYNRMVHYFKRLRKHGKERLTAEVLELDNMSKIVCVPCREDTIRGFSAVHLLIIDEAARVPDVLYRTVRPMLAVSRGRLIALSTPYGKRGWFWNAWARDPADDWQRIAIRADQCPRIDADFLDQERRALGESWFRQEYCCSFESVEGLVYPDFAQCLVKELPEGIARADGLWRMERRPQPGQPADDDSIRRVGGIDFGFRNPFAALWGIRDRDDVLWITREHYARNQPLSYHAEHLPRNCTWYADPSGAGDIDELIRGNYTVRKGENSIRSGIGAVSARIRDGSLRVLEGRCPNLVAEAGLYTWGESDDRKGEAPIDIDNHALAALRYLICTLDARNQLRRAQAKAPQPAKSPEQLAAEAEAEENRKWWEWVNSEDPRIWRPVG